MDTLFLTLPIFARLIRLIENSSLDRGGAYMSLQRLRAYTDRTYQGAIDELALRNSQLSKEIEALYEHFKGSGATRRSELDLVLVEYDNKLDTIGGVAAKEHPLKAIKRRIREFRTVVGD
ncbi:MAG: hypothetical protein IPK68_10810 [Bdellovibrionales bacterium]|nr:hypothetical protein [Bdellovibrionales bacterium]